MTNSETESNNGDVRGQLVEKDLGSAEEKIILKQYLVDMY